MRLVQTYDDGSFSIEYERGDVVTLSNDYECRDLWGQTYHVMRKGTKVTITSVRQGSSPLIDFVRFTDGDANSDSELVGGVFDKTDIDPTTLQQSGRTN